MRYSQIIKESEGQPGYDWSTVIKTVRSFVLSKVKINANYLEGIRDLMFNTDDFHDVSSMDDLSHALDGDISNREWVFKVEEAVANAVEYTGEMIKEYIGTETTVTVAQDISGADFSVIMQKACPELYQAALAAKKIADVEYSASNKARGQANMKALGAGNDDAILQSVLDAVESGFEEGKTTMFEWMKEEMNSVPRPGPSSKGKMPAHVFKLAKNVALTVSDMKAITSAEQLFQLAKTKLQPIEMVHHILEMTIGGGTHPQEIERSLMKLRASPYWKKKLYNAIGAKYL